MFPKGLYFLPSGKQRGGRRFRRAVGGGVEADGSYAVDDAGLTPADYIKHTIVTNGAISLAAFAPLLVVLRP